MTNAISSFTHVVAAPSFTLASSGEAAAVAFYAMLDTAKGVPDTLQCSKADVATGGPEVSAPGEDQSFAVETAALPFADVVPNTAPPGMPLPTDILRILQSDFLQAASRADVRDHVEHPTALSVNLLPPVLADVSFAEVGVLNDTQRQAAQNPRGMNDLWLQLQNPFGSGDAGLVAFGNDLNLVSPNPVQLVEHKSGATDVLSVAAQEETGGGGVQALSDAQTLRPPSADKLASADKNKSVWHADLDQLPAIGTDPGGSSDQPSISSPPASRHRPAFPILSALPGMPISERLIAAEPDKSVVVNPPDGPALVSGADQLELLAVVMPHTSDTALYGFQMRVGEMAEASVTPTAENRPVVLAAPAARPVVPSTALPINVLNVTSEMATDNFIQPPENIIPVPLITGMVPFSEIPLQPQSLAPSNAATIHNGTTVSLRDLPQAVSMALRTDPSKALSLQIDPIELGTVAFNMDTGPAGLVVTISAERPETLELLRRYADQLLADLRQSGFQGASLQFGHSGTSGQDQRRPEHMPAPSANPLAAVAPQFDTLARKPSSFVGSGLDLRL